MACPFKAIPGPRGLPLIGSVLDYSKHGPHSFERLYLAKRENYVKYGRIYKERLGPGVTLVQVFDPEDVGLILQADGKIPLRPAIPITIAAHRRDGFKLGLGSLNGDSWYKLRTSVQKLMMRPHAVAAYLPAQNAVANDFLRMIDSCIVSQGVAKSGEDLNQLLLKYTMESIGVVCFGSRLGALAPSLPDDSVAHRMFLASGKMFKAVQKTTFAFPWYFLFRTKLYEQYRQSKVECDSIARSYIQEVLDKTPKGSSALPEIDLHRATRDPDPECPHFLSTMLSEERLDTETVVGITTDLFIAGIDSTANALSFALYNLSRNPDAQQRLANEIRSVLGERSEVTADDIENMPYVKAVVKESFRLNFPVEGGTTRILAKDMVISGYQVPKKTLVAFNNQTMCLQEEYFERSDQYLPERWLKDGSATLRPPPRFVMLPFGHGPRMCIGRRFAQQEIYLAIIKIVQHFRLEYAGTGEVGMLNRVFTMPDRPIHIHFTRR